MSTRPTLLQPLALRDFRLMWLAWCLANLSMWVHDVSAAWLMVELGAGAALVAWVQAASSLPIVLLAFPSGALADTLDRRRYFAFTQVWVALVALVLALSAGQGWLGAALLLALSFLNGMGMAMRWPVFPSMIPQLVGPGHLNEAVALNALSTNMARIAGPLLAGGLLAVAGSAWVFGLNALFSLLACGLILKARYAAPASPLPAEGWWSAMRVGLRFAWHTPELQGLAWRSVLFFFQCTALMALLPLVAGGLGRGATGYTALLGAMGVGAVLAAVWVPRLRGRFALEQVVAAGALAFAAAALCVALAQGRLWLALAGCVLAGAAWMAAANTLMLWAQLALPDWSRARGMAIMQVAVMAGTALGALGWGALAERVGVPASIAASAALAPVLLWFMRRHPMAAPDAQRRQSRPRPVPVPVNIDVAHGDGPVRVSIEYRIEPGRLSEFKTLMQQTRDARLRLGSQRWQLLRDIHDPALYVETFSDETWAEHLRRMERFTQDDQSLLDRRQAMHSGDGPPRVRRLIGAGPVEGGRTGH